MSANKPTKFYFELHVIYLILLWYFKSLKEVFDYSCREKEFQKASNKLQQQTTPWIREGISLQQISLQHAKTRNCKVNEANWKTSQSMVSKPPDENEKGRETKSTKPQLHKRQRLPRRRRGRRRHFLWTFQCFKNSTQIAWVAALRSAVAAKYYKQYRSKTVLFFVH